jgi:hypothetical protein
MTTTDLARLRSLAEHCLTIRDKERSTGHIIVTQAFDNLAEALDPQTVLALLDAAEASERLDVKRLARALDNGLQLGQPWTSEASYDEFLLACASEVAREYAATPPPATVDEQ